MNGIEFVTHVASSMWSLEGDLLSTTHCACHIGLCSKGRVSPLENSNDKRDERGTLRSYANLLSGLN